MDIYAIPPHYRPRHDLLQGKTVVLNLSGRGDKDVQQIAALNG